MARQAGLIYFILVARLQRYCISGR